MATRSTFYLNAPSIGSATAAFSNNDLTVCAPDGFYSDGVIVRQQVGCLLLPQQSCPTCSVPCGVPIDGEGFKGIYLVNLDAGNSVGAIIVRFDPINQPDGIRALFNSNTYNKLTSPVDGLHKSTNANNYTFVGRTSSDCGISGTTYPALVEKLYNGTTFVDTGSTQAVTVAPGDVSLSTTTPGNLMMVIPKPTASPSVINFQMVGPCSGTKWYMDIPCPVLLTGFSSSSMFASSALACVAAKNQTYYNASLDNTPGIIDVFDFVYSDNIGVSQLSDGFYASNSIAGGANWFQVTSGVVVAVGNCGIPFSSTSVQTTSILACGATRNQTYYAATATITTGSSVYSNINLATSLPDGFYTSNNLASGAEWFQVTSGVISAVGSCGIPFLSTLVQTTSPFACAAARTETYYATTATINTGSAVYSNNSLTTPLPNGFYTSNNLAVGEWFQVTSGVISSVGTCPPPPPDCSDRRVVFQICNSNSITDDNFDIYLNNVYIGAVNLQANAQVGSVFIADLNTAVSLGSADFVCPLSGMVTYHFNPAILLSVNVLEMRNTQNNGAGNLGSVGVRNYLLTGTTLATPCVIANLTYSGDSGESFTLNFNYTACCPT